MTNVESVSVRLSQYEEQRQRSEGIENQAATAGDDELFEKRGQRKNITFGPVHVNTFVRRSSLWKNDSAARKLYRRHWKEKSPYQKVFIIVNVICWVNILFGFVKFGIGLKALVHGKSVQMIAEVDGLFYSGICQLIVGVSSSFLPLLYYCSMYSFYKSVHIVKPNHSKYLVFGVLYVFVTSVVSLVLVVPILSDDLISTVSLGMFDSISSSYGIHSTVTQEWDYLQEHESCCGANNLTEWFDSDWVNEEVQPSPATATSIVPISCRRSLEVFTESTCWEKNSNSFDESHIILPCSLSHYSLVRTCADVYYESTAHLLRYYMGVSATFVFFEIVMLIILLFLPKSLRVEAYGSAVMD